ncbi:phosphoglycolate phosphatase [Enterovibrio coralii]|uniref:Phosphoglycolate phosphatase n=2 Tax=Enterovibrio coralii TaxID=294935 RepID=A0A135I8M7_9GAMM|nr:phosphoglycolate phosphatase [Enterovibrio coralii]
MDSVGRIVSSLDEAARLTGGLPTLSGDELKQMIGLSLDKGYEFLYPDVSLDKRDTWKAHYAQQFREDNPTPAALYPNVFETLNKLKEAGYLLAIATGKSRVGLDRAMDETGTAELFVGTRTADQTASKPDPLMIHELLDSLGITAADAVMVGDTSHDMLLANNAGVDAIAITWGVHDKETLSAYRPVAVIDNIESLLSI